MVDGNTRAVELAAEHLSADGHSKHITSELAMGVRVVDFGGTLEDLNSSVSKRAKYHGAVNTCTLRNNHLPGRLRACQQFRAPGPYGSGRLRA